jgi:CheY-like chemotaxis protein/two-component sensor histidine kinase
LQVESSLNTSIEREKKATYLKNFFLSNISHEIRTPLNAISGLASLLKSKVEKEIEPTTKEFINGIIQNSNRLLNLLNNILDFSRLEANDIVINQKHCSLNEITKNICELHKFKINDKKLNLETTFSDIPNIITDRANLEKVINDIIDNAVRYTDKGAISIETGFYKEYDEVFVRIKDTGVGIDNEYLPYIFDTFSQESIGYERKYQGMGLGLPLSKRLLELMGGRIEISSQKDKGTIVNIFIPSNISIQKNDTKEQKINLISDDIFKQKQFEVFLVEDDYFNKLVIHNLLERITNVTSATNGQEALDLIEKRLEEGIEFDIMLIDINLPDGWDGIKLMKIIKEKWPIYKDVIFIAQTAYSNEKDKKAIMDAGFNEYITKPIDSDYLINLVKHKLMQ